jgi:hypothetical protein
MYLAGLLSLVWAQPGSSSINCCLCYSGKVKKFGHKRQEGLQQRGRRGGVALQMSLGCLEGDSNGNASETKANESFDNGVFFDIEAKRTPSLESKLFSKRSEHIR